MKPGPKVKTDAQKKHEGTFRSGRANPAPKPAVCARMPSTLSAGAKTVWKRLAPSLAQLSMLTIADRDVFALYCEWVSTAQEAAKAVKKGSFITETPSGHRQVAADLSVFKQASEMVIKLADRFGLTPTSRQDLRGFLGAVPDPSKGGAGDGGEAETQKPKKARRGAKRGATVTRLRDRAGRPIGAA